MDRILKLLQNYKGRLALLIGNESLERLIIFIDGYELAHYELTGQRIGFNAAFQRFIERHEGVSGNTDLRWSDILLKDRSHEDALELFYGYLDVFEKIG